MKSDVTTKCLNWALTIVVAATAVFAIQYYFKTREARNLQTQIMLYQNKQALLNNMIADCAEYSKRNPAINPILEANGIKEKSSSSGAKPAAK